MLLPPGLQLERARSLLADAGDITTEDINEFISLSSEREEGRIAEADARHQWITRSAIVAMGAVIITLAIMVAIMLATLIVH